MSGPSPGDNEYVVGPSNARKSVARFETKPGHDSGRSYERWRSWEQRPETPRRGKEDVFVPVHRLLAVVACYPEDMAVSEILAHMDDKDVHHQSGVEWDNRPENLAVREHGTHSAITNAQMRAWARDDQRQRERARRGKLEADCCDRCGEPADVLAESAGFEGERCIDCATETADGATIEVG